MKQTQLRIIGALAVLLAATACTATPAPTGATTTAPSPPPGKAVSADTKETTQAELAAAVLPADSYESGSGGLDQPTGNLDASLASGTLIQVEVACVGTGSMTVTLASGAEGDKREVSEAATCHEGGASSHTMQYRLAAKGLTVSFDPAEGTRGGYAYAVLKAR